MASNLRVRLGMACGLGFKFAKPTSVPSEFLWPLLIADENF